MIKFNSKVLASYGIKTKKQRKVFNKFFRIALFKSLGLTVNRSKASKSARSRS